MLQPLFKIMEVINFFDTYDTINIKMNCVLNSKWVEKTVV